MRHVLSVALVAGSALLPRVAGAALEEQCAWTTTTVVPGATDVMSTPVVVDLDRDGRPEIVFVSFTESTDVNGGHDGVLRIVSGSDCREVFSDADGGCRECVGTSGCLDLDDRGEEGFLCPACSLAAGDLDGDGLVEIVGVHESLRRLVVFEHDGTVKWCSARTSQSLQATCAPALVDLDLDGTPEILATDFVFTATGEILSDASGSYYEEIGLTAAADLDEDGYPSAILGGGFAYQIAPYFGWGFRIPSSFRFSSTAVADMDGDCAPDLVAVSRNAEVVGLASVRGPGGLGSALCMTSLPDDNPPQECNLTFPPGSTGHDFGQGGPPVVADIDGDGVPEVGVSGGSSYTMFRFVAGVPCRFEPIWSRRIQDCSSRQAGSTMFDLDGDGRLEVLHSDERHFRIWDALTGTELALLENSNGTLVEYPVVADVDGDGQAEIVLPANDYDHGSQRGLRVLHDPATRWMPARAIHNQHADHVTNVRDDGSIPAIEPSSWDRLNTFRVQSSGGPSDERRPECPAAQDACRIGPPTLFLSCNDQPACAGGIEVQLAAVPPDGFLPSELRHDWTIDCGGAHQELSGPVLVACVPLACTECTVTLAISLASGAHLDTCTQQIHVREQGSGTLDRPPPDAVVECGSVPPQATLQAVGACGLPAEVRAWEDVLPLPCPDRQRIDRFWLAQFCSGNRTLAHQTLTVRDTLAPLLLGVPGDVDASCAPPAPPPITAEDACSGAPPVTLAETRVDGPCPHSFELRRTWTAIDDCGNAASTTQVVRVRDDVPPVLAGTPADVTVACGAVPPPATPTATDDCGAAPPVTFDERRVPGPCPDSYDLVRTWTATDACDNAASATQVVRVRDDVPPELVVPPPLVLECSGGGGVASDDPRIVAWLALARAWDACAGALPVRHDAPGSFPVSCASSGPSPVAFRAVDACGNEVQGTSTVAVVDTTPPAFVAVDLPECLWSPRHGWACLGDLASRVVVEDACDAAPRVRIEECASSQPDEAPLPGDRGGRAGGNGDGHHAPDCALPPDRSTACLRLERQGTDPAGRVYVLRLVAEDACGNRAELPWRIRVPHDQSEHDCPRWPDSLAPHAPLPWE